MTMNYYNPPKGIERALRSRIRRCVVALIELKPAIEYLQAHVPKLSEEVTTENLQHADKMYREAYLALTGDADVNCINQADGIRQAQERLLNAPESAEHVRRYVKHLHEAANGVIQDFAYRVDAGDLDPDEPLYQNIRKQAIMILGYADVVTKAIDSGFIVDARGYQLYGK